MKRRLSLGLILTGLSALAADRVQFLTLDESTVVEVPIATNRVTTLSFPGPIAGIDAAGVATGPEASEGFLLAHAKGTAFFSLRALKPGATANLNVRWRGATYAFELVESPDPVLSLNLRPQERLQAGKAPKVSAPGLLALLDKAKAYPLLKAQHPEILARVEARTFSEGTSWTDLGAGLESRVEEVYRFDPEDTLVFRATLRNRGAEVCRYRPESLHVRAGNRIYPQSVSDGRGEVPPGGEVTLYLAITGNPDGSRAELSIRNEFAVLVERVNGEETEVGK